VGQALAAYLAKYRDVLLLQEVGVRLGSPEAVHHVRTATRRLRSVLAAWRRHLADVDSAEHVRAELKWVGEALGRARDSYVLREHLDEVLDAEPPELVLGPVRTRVDDELAAEYRHGVEQALEAMSSERYFALMEALDRLVESPADPDRGAEPAADAMPKVLAREVKRVRRAEAAVPPVGEAGRDAALHELRKKAKRLRYAADAAKPVLRRPAKRLAKRAKRVQETLGGRQDAVVAAGRLRELAVQAYLAGENGFSFGRMHALEGNRADESERAFRAAWEKLPRRHVRASLRTD
jgi:CHAD domain-containing protein